MNDASSLGPVLVIIPTYNESQNIESIASRIRRAVPEAHLLVTDDNSPDGTGEVADRLAGRDDHIHVLHRKNKQGLGAAYLAGFQWGLDHGYEILVEHDADGSHQPEQLPALLQALADGADMARGARWVRGGHVVSWPLHRELISRAGSLWTRLWLGIPVKDTTGGFNAFRADALRGIDLDEVASAGYCFQIDLLWRTIRRGYVVTEVPIEFVEREFGDSKMNRNIVIEALIRSTLWGVEYRAGQAKTAVLSLLSRPKTRRRTA